MQPVTRRKPAPKTTDVAFREQGPWSGRGDCGKLAGGGEDMRKEGSSPPTALIAARADRWGLGGGPLPAAGVHPAWPLQPFLHFHRGGHFLSPPQGSTVWVPSLSPACLTETWARLCLPCGEPSRRGMGVWLPLNLLSCPMPESGRSSFQDQLQLCRLCPASKGRSCSLGLYFLRNHVCSPGSSFLCDSC